MNRYIFLCCMCLLICGCNNSNNNKKPSIESSETEDSVKEDVLDNYYGFGDEANASNIFNYNEEYGRYDGKLLMHFDDTTKLQEGNKRKILEVLKSATGDKVSARDVQESELSKEMYSFTFGYTNVEKSEYNQLLLSGNYAVNSQGEIFHVDGERLLKNLNLSEHTDKCDCGASLAYVYNEIIPNIQYLCIDNGEWTSSKLLIECYHEIVDREGTQYVVIKDEFVDTSDTGILIHPKVNSETDNIVCNYGDEKLVFTLINNDEYDNFIGTFIMELDVLIDGKWYKMPELDELSDENRFFYTIEDKIYKKEAQEIEVEIGESQSFVWDYSKYYANWPKGKYRIIISVRRKDNGQGGSSTYVVQEFEIR